MTKLFPTREVLFQGSKERLHRTVTREGGTFLDNRTFKILLKSKQAKPFDKRSFWFHCIYESTAEGYLITYDVAPSAVTTIRAILFFMFDGCIGYLAWIKNAIEMIPILFFLFLFPTIMYFSQYRSCISQFQKTFGTVTIPRTQRSK